MAEAMSMGDSKMQQMSDNEGGKRSAEENVTASENNKRPRGDGQKVTFRFLIPSISAGGIIGKAGANIKQLRGKFNATVTVPDCSGPERILTIVTDLEAALECIQEIIPILDASEQKPESFMVRLLVHQSLAGAIIGKEGCKIKEIREQSGANIKVFSDVCPNSTDRIIQVGGVTDKIIDALRELQNLISATPIKGPSQPYDPYCFDPFYALTYGGYTGSTDSKKGGGGGRMGGHSMGRGGGQYGGGGRPMGGFDYMGGGGRGGRGRGYGGRGLFMNPVGGMSGNRGGRGGGGGSRLPEPLDPAFYNQSGRDGFESLENTERTIQVTIPKDLAGAIIGSQGSRIRAIRTRSCATIKIEDAKPDSIDRIITITGTDDQINYAQYLLQESVRQFSGLKY
ncbi:heterogeneous nuclear ribonucleoprotein K-like [Diadema antillarum]|uniref:heterogeneous nuclear ribonucleoprotein K-like n=1 Tax=Diadema antillarum TaxID=105358 RepID=UPI003A871637